MAGPHRPGVRRIIRAMLKRPADDRVTIVAVTLVACLRVLAEQGVSGLAPDELWAALLERIAFFFVMHTASTAILRLLLPPISRGAGTLISIGVLFGLLSPLLSIFFGLSGPSGIAWLIPSETSRLTISVLAALFAMPATLGFLVYKLAGLARGVLGGVACGAVLWLMHWLPPRLLSSGLEFPPSASVALLFFIVALVTTLAERVDLGAASSRSMIWWAVALLFVGVTASLEASSPLEVAILVVGVAMSLAATSTSLLTERRSWLTPTLVLGCFAALLSSAPVFALGGTALILARIFPDSAELPLRNIATAAALFIIATQGF